jgi:protein associated with RNAse G/E
MMDNYIVAAEDRVAAVGQAPPSAERRHVERRWTVPTIRLYLPGEAFSVWVFFDDEGRFASWYGNLEAPFVRTGIGIDTLDHTLDVVADAKGRWRWKDEPEFARHLELRLDTAEHQARVRAAGEAFIKRLEAGTSPFDQGWPDWRPPSDWVARALPPSWRDDLGTAADLNR